MNLKSWSWELKFWTLLILQRSGSHRGFPSPKKISGFHNQNLCENLNRTSFAWTSWFLVKVHIKANSCRITLFEQFWLLSVENDEAIVRNGCEKEDLKIWKKQIFISWFSVFFFSWWVLDESGPSIYSGETKNGKYVVENGSWEFLVRLVAGNGRWER